MERWLCVQADVDARPGGGYVFNVTGSHTTRGTFLVVEPGRRLVYTWLFDHVEPPLPTTVEVTLTPVGRGTRVRLHHHGFVEQPTSDRHTAGRGALPAAAGRHRRRGRTGRRRLARRIAAAYRSVIMHERRAASRLPKRRVSVADYKVRRAGGLPPGGSRPSQRRGLLIPLGYRYGGSDVQLAGTAGEGSVEGGKLGRRPFGRRRAGPRPPSRFRFLRGHGGE